MVIKKGLKLPVISQLKDTKKIDRSTRTPPEGDGRNAWEEKPKENDDKATAEQETTVQDEVIEQVKQDTEETGKDPELTEQVEQDTEEIGKDPEPTEQVEQGTEETGKDPELTEQAKQDTEETEENPKLTDQINTPGNQKTNDIKKDNLESEGDITEHQLAVPLNSKEYAMYNKIVERVNSLGVPKKVRGTDIQRASIHLLSKMKPDVILKAHYEAMMPLKKSEQENNKIHPVSVSLQQREFQMFNNIIANVNRIGLPKKVRGTDIQRASIYLMAKMKADRILKAHYKAIMP